MPKYDLSRILNARELMQWIKDPATHRDSSYHRTPGKRTESGRKKLARLEKRTDNQQVISILRQYVQECIPQPRRTELDFWSLSCFPSGAFGSTRIACCSLATMETLVVDYDESTSEAPGVFINIEAQNFLNAYQPPAFFEEYPDTELYNELPYADLRKCNLDGVQIRCFSLDTAERVLNDPAVLRAARVLNVHIMGLGGAVQKRGHNPYLADLVV